MQPETLTLDYDGEAVVLHLEPRRQYLFVRVEGPHNTLAASMCYWRELARECQRRRVERLLVVDELEGPPMPAEDLAALVSAMTGTILQAIRIAFVEPVATHLPLMEHGQILAQEQGFQAGVFGSQLAAERWLLYGGEGAGTA